MKNYSASLLYSLDNLVVPYSFFNIIQNVYIPPELGFDPLRDPFLSPVIVPEEFLKKFPITRIMSGNKDPFHVDSWRFTKNLFNLKKDIKLIIYDYLPHGFMEFDGPKGSRDDKIYLNDICKEMLDLI